MFFISGKIEREFGGNGEREDEGRGVETLNCWMDK